MRLAVFGATGKTGRILLGKALERDHHVVAYARDPSHLDIVHPSLEIVSGDLDDAEAISTAVCGRDAAISVLGPKGRTRGLPIPTGMAHIVDAMKTHGVRRLVATATPSCHAAGDKFDLSFALAVLTVRLLLPSAYRNIVGAAQVVAASDLDWTLVRIPLLSDSPGCGPPHVGHVGGPGTRLVPLPREALAEFLLTQITDGSLLHQAPVVCPA
jgi:uncharacterized protein YbjT (DUF2867 family)